MLRRRVAAATLLTLAVTGLAAIQTGQSARAATVPLAQWTFEEGSGSVTDDIAGNGHDGRLSGATWTTGHSGGGLAFGGDGDHVEVGSAVDLALTRTIEVDLRVRFDSGAGTSIQKLLEKDGAPVSYGVRVSETGRIGLFWAGAWRESSPLTWSNGAWYQLTVRHDGATVTFSRNGVPAGSVTNSDATSTSSGRLFLGRGRAGFERPLHGRLDDVSIGVPDSVAPAVVSTAVSAASLPAGTPVTVTAEITGAWGNPDDPDSVAVEAEITTPNGSVQHVPGFLYQDFQVDDGNQRIAPAGSPTWTIRYTPRATGSHTVVVTVTTPSGTDAGAAAAFTATTAPPSYDGFVRLSTSANKRYYEYVHSGETFFSFGPNLDLPTVSRDADAGTPPTNPERGLFGDGVNKPATGATPENLWLVYDRYRDNLERMANVGVNTARLRVDSRFLPLELFPDAVIPGYPTGLRGFAVGRYHAAMAWITDQAIELGRQNGIAIQLTAWNGNSSTNWGDSTYARNKNETLVKRRLRYDLARWGYSPSLMSWEYFNELPAGTNPKTDPFWVGITSWLRAEDINDHLVTNSYTGVDQTEQHIYADSSQSLISLASFTGGVAAPHIVSEYGQRRYYLIPGTDLDAQRAREGVWASLVGHKTGAWYWWMHEHLDVYGLYETAYAGIAAFTAAEELRDHDWVAAAFTQVSGPGGLTYRGMVDPDRALIWISRTPSNEEVDRAPADGNVVAVAGLAASEQYTLQWWDTLTGAVTATQTVTSSGSGSVQLEVPDGVTRAVAAKLIRS